MGATRGKNGGMKKFLERVVPLSATAMAMFAWQHRDDLVDWGAFGVRAVAGFAEGRQEDVMAEARLRGKLNTDKRTRDASGVSVSVRDGTAKLTGVVDPDTRALAVAFARRTQGVHAVDDQLEVIHGRPEVTD
jgi:osmotically-inducible protein OsmY